MFSYVKIISGYIKYNKTEVDLNILLLQYLETEELDVILKLGFKNYTLYSALGILVWNGVLMGVGYILGESVFRLLE